MFESKRELKAQIRVLEKDLAKTKASNDALSWAQYKQCGDSLAQHATHLALFQDKCHEISQLIITIDKQYNTIQDLKFKLDVYQAMEKY